MLLQPFQEGALPHALLADFGLAELFEKRSDGAAVRMKGTPAYLSPEGFDGMLSCKSDTWAVGIMLFELFMGKRPFEAKGHAFMLWNEIMQTNPSLDELPPGPREVVATLLSKDAHARPTAKECYAKAWFKGPEQVASPDPAALKQLDSLGHSNYFHRAVMLGIAAGMGIKEMHSLVEAFKFLDTNQSGSLSLEDLQGGLVALGVHQDPHVVLTLLDLDHSGIVSYTEFLAGALQLSTDLTDGMLQHAFESFDLDNDGLIVVRPENADCVYSLTDHNRATPTISNYPKMGPFSTVPRCLPE